jgi:hypothetical protein
MEKLTVAKKEKQRYFNVFNVFVIVSIKEQLYNFLIIGKQKHPLRLTGKPRIIKLARL